MLVPIIMLMFCIIGALATGTALIIVLLRERKELAAADAAPKPSHRHRSAGSSAPAPLAMPAPLMAGRSIAAQEPAQAEPVLIADRAKKDAPKRLEASSGRATPGMSMARGAR